MGRSRRCWRGRRLAIAWTVPLGSAPRSRLWSLWQRPHKNVVVVATTTNAAGQPVPQQSPRHRLPQEPRAATLMAVAGTTVTKSVGWSAHHHKRHWVATAADEWWPPSRLDGHVPAVTAAPAPWRRTQAGSPRCSRRGSAGRVPGAEAVLRRRGRAGPACCTAGPREETSPGDWLGRLSPSRAAGFGNDQRWVAVKFHGPRLVTGPAA